MRRPITITTLVFGIAMSLCLASASDGKIVARWHSQSYDRRFVAKECGSPWEATELLSGSTKRLKLRHPTIGTTIFDQEGNQVAKVSSVRAHTLRDGYVEVVWKALPRLTCVPESEWEEPWEAEELWEVRSQPVHFSYKYLTRETAVTPGPCHGLCRAKRLTNDHLLYTYRATGVLTSCEHLGGALYRCRAQWNAGAQGPLCRATSRVQLQPYVTVKLSRPNAILGGEDRECEG